jgi:hypothetical protein
MIVAWLNKSSFANPRPRKAGLLVDTPRFAEYVDSLGWATADKEIKLGRRVAPPAVRPM